MTIEDIIKGIGLSLDIQLRKHEKQWSAPEIHEDLFVIRKIKSELKRGILFNRGWIVLKVPFWRVKKTYDCFVPYMPKGVKLTVKPMGLIEMLTVWKLKEDRPLL